MAEITNELMYEVLRQIQADIAGLKLGQHDIKTELVAIRGHFVAMQQDVHNLYSILVRHETRLDRIDRRLELSDRALT